MLDITNNKSELTNYGGSELKKTYYIDNHKYIDFIFDGNKLRLAPVCDCGSCLNPLLTEEDMKKLLSNERDFKNEAFNVKSVYKYKGKSMLYYEYFSNPNPELKNAIKNIVPRINLEKINEVIDNIETLSDICKEYYKKAIKIRYDLILSSIWKEISYES